MESRKFSVVVREAVAGDGNAVEAILWRYSPLINRYSVRNGVPDKDLRQYIMLRVTEQLQSFPRGDERWE